MFEWQPWETAVVIASSLLAAISAGFALRKTHLHLKEAQRQQQVLAAVSEVNSNFLLHKDPKRRFGELLETLKTLTGSPIGLIGERMEDEQGRTFMRCYAISNLSWDQNSKALYEDNIQQGIDFYQLDNLFGQTLTSGQVTICNNCEQRPRKIPQGHPEIQRFIGIPLTFRGEVLGIYGLANGPEPYSETFVEWLEPLTNTITAIMHAFRIERAQKSASHRMLQALKEAEDANQIKGDFLATMSHEIRTPLNAVVGMLDSLASTESLSTIQRDYLKTADNAADTLLSLINDVLDFSKIEAGKLSLDHKPVNPTQQLHEVITLAQAIPAARGIDLYLSVKPECPLEVIGDPSRLRQIMHNLIGNAVKFTHKGHVNVCLSPVFNTANDYQGLQLIVEDTGIGISASNLPIIFNAFHQADHSSTREYQGTGLGLAITRHLIEAMGGSIDVVSRPGEGSRFTVTLPLPRHGTANLDTRLALLPLQDCRVLCVTNSHYLYQNLFTLLSPHAACVDCHFKSLQEDEAAGNYNLLLVDDRRYPIDNDSLRPWIQRQAGEGEIVVLGNRDLAQLFIPVSAQLTHPLSPLALVDTLTALYRPELLPTLPEHSHDSDTNEISSITEGLNILIAEDNPVNRKMMEVLMGRAGADYTLCKDGTEVLDVLQSEPGFDLILMDLHMPVLNGLDTTRAIRKLPEPISGIPIIAVTADALAGDREKCLAAGMDNYLSKPVRLTELQQVIDQTLASAFMPAGEMQPVTSTDQVVDFDPDALTTDLGSVENAVLLIHEFANSLHLDLGLIEQALQLEDPDQAASAAHRVKGSARSLQCRQLARQLEAIEHHSRSNHFGRAREQFDQLKSELPALELKLLHFCTQNLNRNF